MRKKQKSNQLELPLEEPSDKFRVSQSKVKTYRKCRRAYHYKYVEKLRAKRKSRALTFGSLVHQMIERDAEGEDPMSVLEELDVESLKLFAAEKAEYGAIIEDTTRIMSEYFAHWGEDQNPLHPARIKGRSAEHSFDIEILPDIVWNGKIDMIGRRSGLRWLVEHKSFKRRPNDDSRWRNLQSVSYFKAMEMLGWPAVDGVCWDYIWSKAPIFPGLLQNGQLSQKSIDTLPSSVMEAIRAHKKQAKDYPALLKQAKDNRSKWFFRVYTPVNEEVKESIFTEFVDTIKEMADNHGVKKDMNPENHCAWCDFEPLCRARLQGLDYEFTKERQYEKSEGRPTEEANHSINHEDF